MSSAHRQDGAVLRTKAGHLRLIEGRGRDRKPAIGADEVGRVEKTLAEIRARLNSPLRADWATALGMGAPAQQATLSSGWHLGMGRCLVGRSPEQLAASTQTLMGLGALGPLREPHIEDFEGEIRFTWNRDDHYIEVTIAPDGAIGWFHGLPDGTFEGDDGEGLGARFRVAMEHARP